MISRKVVQKFLQRELDNHDWIKSVDEKELDQTLEELEVVPDFHTEPFVHQKACFLLGIALQKILFLLPMGLGKTKICLDIARYEHQCGNDVNFLVLVPNLISIESWVEECETHAPDMECVALDGTQEERWEKLRGDGDIFVINYGGIVAMATDLIKFKSKKRRQRAIIKEKVEEIREKFDGVVFDESHKIKNWQSLTFKVCKAISQDSDIRFALTGTPFGRDAQALWSQFFMIDRGETLGKTLTIFRQAFFNQKKNPWGGLEYSLRKDRKKLLYQTIKNRSIRYHKEECPDLPERVDIPKTVYFPSETESYYREVIKEIQAARGNIQETENAFLRMRQLSSGFVSFKDEETDEKQIVKFDDNPKLDALQDIIEDKPEDDKLVVFHEFTKSGDMISEMLDDQKIKHVRLYGETKDKSAAYRKFKDDPKYKVLVVNSAVGASVLNLQNANYVCFYESPVSPITRQQAEKRVWRTGQEGVVFMYDLIMKNSIDEKIMGFLKEGRDLFEEVIEGREEIR